MLQVKLLNDIEILYFYPGTELELDMLNIFVLCYLLAIYAKPLNILALKSVVFMFCICWPAF